MIVMMIVIVMIVITIVKPWIQLRISALTFSTLCLKMSRARVMNSRTPSSDSTRVRFMARVAEMLDSKGVSTSPVDGGGGGKIGKFIKQKPKLTLLVDNTHGLITTNKTKYI